MGECSFGKGFGQINRDKKGEQGIDEWIWKSIPRAIFDGLAKRYQVGDSGQFAKLADSPRQYTSRDF